MKKRLSKRDKKGLSAVVTLLITILLVLVAVGIIWVVIKNILSKGTESMGVQAECLDFNINAVKVVNTSDTAYEVSINRKSGGGDIGGVKLVISNGTDTSSVVDVPGNIAILETKKVSQDFGIVNANKVEVTPYFVDDSGKEQICPQPSVFNF